MPFSTQRAQHSRKTDRIRREFGRSPLPETGNRPADTSRHESWSTNDFRSEPPGPKSLVSLVALVRGTSTPPFQLLYSLAVLRQKLELPSLYTVAAVRSTAISSCFPSQTTFYYYHSGGFLSMHPPRHLRGFRSRIFSQANLRQSRDLTMETRHSKHFKKTRQTFYESIIICRAYSPSPPFRYK